MATGMERVCEGRRGTIAVFPSPSHPYEVVLDAGVHHGSVEPVAHGAPPPVADAGYRWELGDGTTAATAGPVVRHDYFTAVVNHRGTGSFLVTCTLPGGGPTLQRTITIVSPYHLGDRRTRDPLTTDVG